MKNSLLYNVIFISMLLGCGAKPEANDNISQNAVERQVQKLSEMLTEAEKSDDLESLSTIFDENAISMPEYQPMLHGRSEIKAFYQEILQRQNIKVLRKEIDEIIHLDSTVIEIGTFKKEYFYRDADTLLTHNGKYWNVWALKPDGSYKLKTEVFGFFHPIEKPETLTVQLPGQTGKFVNPPALEIPLELRAYNALNEKLVRKRDGALRSQFYTQDAKFMPFQEPSVSSMEEIKPYLIAYSSRGDVTIDSISVDTYQYQYYDDYVLEYATFWVEWSTPSASGRTEGKGIRLWKRQDDKSLKIYRHIGTHNHLG